MILYMFDVLITYASFSVMLKVDLKRQMKCPVAGKLLKYLTYNRHSTYDFFPE